MKKMLHLVAFTTLVFNATNVFAQSSSQNPRNYADHLSSSTNVTAPNYAVDTDYNTYALLRANLGILNFSSITVGFTTPGEGGDNVNMEVQNDKGILSADVLGSISVYVYDSNGKQVASKKGFNVADATLIQGTSRYKISIHVTDDAYDITSVKFSIAGLLTLQNSVRLYDVYSLNNCPPIKGNILHSSQNVTNPQNAISKNSNDYALLTPPLLAGSSNLDIAFSQPGRAGKNVSFNLGEGNILLSADLLQHITLSVFDKKGNVVATKSGFTMAEAQVLPDGKFKLKIETPKGSYKIDRGSITLTTLANLLTNVKVYSVDAHENCNINNILSESRDYTVPSFNIMVAPNPFSTHTILNVNGKTNNILNITISDKTGNIIEQHQVNNVSSVRLLEKAPAGIYFIKVSSGNIVQTQKVIKM